MRRAAQRDGNEQQIIDAARRCGATVQRLSDRGVPDLLIGHIGKTYLVEVKDPEAERGRAQAVKLTPDQANWWQWWRGQVSLVTTPVSIYELLGYDCACGHRPGRHTDAGDCEYCECRRFEISDLVASEAPKGPEWGKP